MFFNSLSITIDDCQLYIFIKDAGTDGCIAVKTVVKDFGIEMSCNIGGMCKNEEGYFESNAAFPRVPTSLAKTLLEMVGMEATLKLMDKNIVTFFHRDMSSR